MRVGASALGRSELCAVRGFTLREAISAAEVGDSKMDAGLGRDPEVVAAGVLNAGE